MRQSREGVFMKKFSFIMLALALALGLAFVSCDNGSGSTGSGGGGGNTPSHTHDWGPWVVTTLPTATQSGVETRTCKLDSSHTETRTIPATGYSFQGTYNATSMGVTMSIVATDTTWSYYAYGGTLFYKGTYTVSGNTITATITESYYPNQKPGDISILTFIDENTIYEPSTGYTYRRVS
jgi:hypothetical protein